MHERQHSNGHRAAANKPKFEAEQGLREHTVRDESYQRILGAAAWSKLASEVRARFSVKPRVGKAVCYAGMMHKVELSFMGWLFAQVCRLIGTPLAPLRGCDVPMLIELTPDKELQGIAWNRRYEFPGNRHVTVRSTKCHANTGEFFEYIGRGFSMRLKLREKNAGLEFFSIGYYFELCSRKFRIPDWLTPGVTTVTHAQLHGDRFRFSLSVEHPLLGTTIHHDGEFYSATSSR